MSADGRWPTPPRPAGRSLTTVTESPAAAAARLEDQARQLALQAFGEMMETLEKLGQQAAGCERLRALPPGLQRIALEARDFAYAKGDLAQAIASNLKR